MNNIITHIKEYKYTEYIILSIVLFIGLLLRIYKIDSPIADWHSWRQADTASVTREFVIKGIDLFDPRYHDISTIQSGKFNPEGFRYVELPIFNAINAFSFKILNFYSLEVWGRLISIFSSILTAIFLFLIGKHYYGKWLGILSAFFYLTIPFNIYFTRVVLPEPLGVMLATASIWYFIVYLDTERIRFLLASSLLLSLSLLVKPYLVFYTLPLAIILHIKYDLTKIVKKKSMLIPFVIYAIIAIVPLLLWRYQISSHPEGIPFYKWVFNGDDIRFKPSFWRWIFSERLGKLILGVWGIIPFSLGILAKKKEQFSNYFLLGMFLYVSVVATANVRHDYYQTLVIPAVVMTLSYGFIYIWSAKSFAKNARRFMTALIFLVMYFTSYTEIKDFYKINHPEIILAGNATEKLTEKEALVIAPYNGDTAFLYQTKRWGWPYRDRSLDELIEKGADYFVSVNFDEQTTEAMKRFTVIEKTDAYVIIDLNQPVI